ncbi:hypothetical protein [Vogesella indigofera]|uniref:hypothetical protein n=1 Tax=Vogesella indigofera TaxID=45465 RepID=UPI00234E5289|nr:hypothetical protein [Vogesella indigofera]MDC7699749.1 hypothetical protein [Vogesella indigofera]
MRLTQTRTRQLCRLLLVAWCLVLAFGVLLACQRYEQASHHFATPGTLQTQQLTATDHAGTHDESALCEQACQTLSAPIAKGEVSVAMPSLLSVLLIAWFLLPPLLLLSPASVTRLNSPATPGGTPPRPHLLFQRFNN